MKGTLNAFEIRKDLFYQNESVAIKANSSEWQIFVYDMQNRCVGFVLEHNENRYSPANGQAEICFYAKYFNEYGRWHRMFVGGCQGGQRIKYKDFEKHIQKHGFYKYNGYIKP